MHPHLAFVHPHGSRFAQEALNALAGYSENVRLYTTLGLKKSAFLSALLSERFFEKKSWVPSNVSISRSLESEVLRIFFERGLRRAKSQKRVDAVYKAVDQKAAQKIDDKVSHVYAYEDGALEVFKRAADLGIQRIYDLPIMYFKSARHIEEQEAEYFPQLRPSLFTLYDSPEKFMRKKQEVSLATKIMVASQVTKRSLTENGIPEQNISVVPYGVDLPTDYPTKIHSSASSPFQVLFVGRVGPRKGVHRLLAAWKLLNLPNASLMLAGINEFPSGVLEKELGTATYVGIKRGLDLARLYASADLFVLPSLVEGFGMVLLEALSYGVPIIGSTHTGAPDLIENHKVGWIIPPSDTEALVQALEHAYLHREELLAMRASARSCAEQYSWRGYRQKLLEAVFREEMQ